MTISLQDKKYMDYAIEIAKSNPDPVTNKGVGCIITHGNGIIGTGARHTWINFIDKIHKCVHAEHAALMECMEEYSMYEHSNFARGATVYVTMEPCAKRWHNTISWHFPSCCELLHQAGVKRVVIGSKDEGFGGGGIEFLHSKNIIVDLMDLNLKFLTKNAKVDDRVKHEFIEKFFK